MKASSRHDFELPSGVCTKSIFVTRLAALVSDDQALSVWEMLRRFGRATPVDELAQDARTRGANRRRTEVPRLRSQRKGDE